MVYRIDPSHWQNAPNKKRQKGARPEPAALASRNITGPLGAPQGIPFTEFT